MDSLASIRRVDLVGVCRGYVGEFENCVIGVSPTPRSDSAHRNHIIYFEAVLCTLYYHHVHCSIIDGLWTCHNSCASLYIKPASLEWGVTEIGKPNLIIRVEWYWM